jgi:four helix bundle protein
MGEGNNPSIQSMGSRGFKELIVWQKAKALAVSVYGLTGQGRLARDYGLVDQLRRCAVSIPSNIAEGDERDTDKDLVRFFYMAKGSLAELITQLEIAHEVGRLSTEEVAQITNECEVLGRMLGALIKARWKSRAPIASGP